MGGHHVIDHRQQLDEALRAIGLGEVDQFASLTASDHHLPAIARAIAPQGRLSLIDDQKIFDMVPLKRKSVSVHWELMVSRLLYRIPDMIRRHEFLTEVSRLVDAVVLRTTMARNADRIDAATPRDVHLFVERRRCIGETVLAGF